MRLLVTGGAGFIGSNFVQYILRNTDHEVITLDALTYAGDTTNLDGVLDSPRHEFVEGDIRDVDLVGDLFANCDAVVHFAAQTHVDRSIEGSAQFVQTNVVGTHALLERARDSDLRRFVQISTDEVYGEITTGSFTEDDNLEPRNPYAASKASADHFALSFHETYGLPVLVTRPSNNYGPQQHMEKLIPKLIDRASSGEPLPIYGDGSNVREWTYVEDTCRAIEAVLEHGEPGEIYNAGSGEERENLEVGRAIIDAVDANEGLIEFIDDRPGHDQRYALDSSKLRNLGWTQEWSFEDGLEATIEHYC